LIIDAAGNLYGTAQYGGASNNGIVFELTPQSGGTWKYGVLHSYNGRKGGSQPFAGLFMDTAGNLYGTTVEGGGGAGIAYELTFNSVTKRWQETILHIFKGGHDGVNPYAAPFVDSAGNAYGTTIGGGAHNAGTVYEITP